MKTDPAQQAKTISELALRCEGPNQFENFASAFRISLAVPKAAVLKEDARWKKQRAKKRPRKLKSLVLMPVASPSA